MDPDTTPAHASTKLPGGTVEPTNRAAIAIAKFQKPAEPAMERFELRDPFAEVTYHAKSLADMVTKAQQLGSTRITAIAPDGTRTPIVKEGNEWRRGPSVGPLPDKPMDKGPTKDEVTPPRAEMPAKSSIPFIDKDPIDGKALAKIDAQADRTALVARLEEALKDRYVIKRAPLKIGDVSIGQTEYRFRGDTSRIAFTESTFKLATDTNSPSVARSMVDVAQSRNWKGLRVSGSEDFRRLVWLEASVRGVKAVGYEPNVGDLDVLKREQHARMTNRIEPTQDTSSATTAENASARGGGGRKAVVAAIEAILVAKGVPEAKRTAVLEAADEKLAQRFRAGIAPKVKIYDKAAEPQRSPAMPAPEQTRGRDRAAPSHAR